MLEVRLSQAARRKVRVYMPHRIGWGSGGLSGRVASSPAERGREQELAPLTHLPRDQRC